MKRELRRRFDRDVALVKAILRRWDPIGVLADYAESPARDEYDSYAPQLLSMLYAGAPLSEVVDRLENLRAKHMGLPARRSRDEQIAQELIALGLTSKEDNSALERVSRPPTSITPPRDELVKFKIIKSAAHNFADSFASTLNYVADDYVLSYLARRAIATGETELVIDLLSGRTAPFSLAAPPVEEALSRRVSSFPKHLARERIDVTAIKHAVMRVQIEISRCSAPTPYYNYRTAELPVEVSVAITDNRGVEHVSRVRRWWQFSTDGPEFLQGRRTVNGTITGLWAKLKQRLSRIARANCCVSGRCSDPGD